MALWHPVDRRRLSAGDGVWGVWRERERLDAALGPGDGDRPAPAAALHPAVDGGRARPDSTRST